MTGAPTGPATARSRVRSPHLCRECTAVLWRAFEVCPSCRAQSPGARPSATARPSHVRLAAAVAGTAPVALLLADEVLHRLLAAA